jgi:hypothetical protein
MARPAPVGALVGLYYDSPRLIEVGDYLRTPKRRCYLIDSLRRQLKGKHAGRWHIKAIVVAEADIPADALVHPLMWYRR